MAEKHIQSSNQHTSPNLIQIHAHPSPTPSLIHNIYSNSTTFKSMDNHSPTNTLILLQDNPIKDYAWGSSNHQCTVARLTGKQMFNHYAQMWMGVHVNGESSVSVGTGQNSVKMKLSQFLASTNSNPLSYLFKVLSIEKCLSLQVHPNKSQAVILNKSKPHLYSDDNDKPEMFYTLTEFQCFFGYLGKEEFERLISMNIFKDIFGQNKPSNPRQAILAILNLPPNSQKTVLESCLNMLPQIHPERYKKCQSHRKIWKILQDFPHDIGIVVSFFLDYQVLPPGVCYYIQSCLPHAYIFGECLEIMKNSDNVCRLGLTPKFKDLDVIADVLGNNFQPIPPIDGKFDNKNGFISQHYCQNSLNFQIIQPLPTHPQNTNLPITPIPQIRILLTLTGEFSLKSEHQQNYQLIKQGTVVLLTANTQYQLKGEGMGKGLLCLGWSDF